MSKEKVLAIWDEVPSVECKKLCSDQCSLIPMVGAEAEIVANAIFPPASMTKPAGSSTFILDPREPGTLKCPALRGNRCSIYKSRPLICRLYGVAEGLTCSHGCEPERIMTKKEASKLLKRLGNV